MEESRAASRVTIHDPVFDEIQNQRYRKHQKSLERLRSLENKSNSLYTVNNSRTHALDLARKLKIQSFAKVFPPDIEYQNCMKRVQ